MLAGVPLDVAERAIGKARKTQTRDLRRGLRKLGFRPGARMLRLKPLQWPPPLTLVRVRWRGTKVTHWVVHEKDGRIACPERGWTTAIELHQRGELLSYLPVRATLTAHLRRSRTP